MIVVDASLVARWVFWEADGDRALSFLERYTGAMAAPDLLLTELASAFVRRTRGGDLTGAEVAEALAVLTGFCGNQIEPYRVTAELVSEAVDLAFALDHKLPDCVYLALAIGLDCELATCDRQFQARASAMFPRVKLLDAFLAR